MSARFWPTRYVCYYHISRVGRQCLWTTRSHFFSFSQWMFAVNFCNIHGTGVVKLPESAKRLIEELDMTLKEEKLGGH